MEGRKCPLARFSSIQRHIKSSAEKGHWKLTAERPSEPFLLAQLAAWCLVQEGACANCRRKVGYARGQVSAHLWEACGCLVDPDDVIAEIIATGRRLDVQPHLRRRAGLAHRPSWQRGSRHQVQATILLHTPALQNLFRSPASKLVHLEQHWMVWSYDPKQQKQKHSYCSRCCTPQEMPW